MSNKETKTRVANAFRAMKDLGISENKVKPVLKSLLKLYDKNWALIEEENYRALADAIFEKDEVEAGEHSKKIVNNEAADTSKEILNSQKDGYLEEEAQATEEPERPLKRLRHRYRNGQSSSANTSVPRTPLVRPKEEPEEPTETYAPQLNGSQAIVGSPGTSAGNRRMNPEAVTDPSPGKNKGKQPMSPTSLPLPERCEPCQPSGVRRSQPNSGLRNESGSPSHPMNLRDRGLGPVSLQNQHGEEERLPESSSHALLLKEPKVEPGIQNNAANHVLVKPKDEPVTDDIPYLELPIATIYPDKPNGDSLSTNGIAAGNHSHEARSSSNLDIASTPSGEVKISFSCGLTPRRPDFHMPSLEAVLKLAEDKCLSSVKTLEPNFSVVNLMKEMCLCFLELGMGSHSEAQNTTNAIPGSHSVAQNTTNVIPNIGSPSKSSPMHDPGARGLCPSPLNRSIDTQFDAHVPGPTPQVLPPPCNSTNNESQPNDVVVGDEVVIDMDNQENCAGEPNDLSLVVVPPLLVTPEIARPSHNVVDIAKGQEKVIITLVNEVNDEQPPSFHYIPHNTAFQNAYMNFTLARVGDNNCCPNCVGDCLSLSTPCACSYESGGEFAYNKDGLIREELLKECISMNRDPEKHCQFFCKECPLERSKSEDITEPCKGHLVRKFIKECWLKCGCHKNCGNRVVQRGISRKLQVFMTPAGKGWGLRTLEDLPKGAFVCEYVGEVLTNAELFERVQRKSEGEKHSYPVLLDADWCAEGVLKDEEALCLDATYYGNVARFINHRCYDSTLVEIPVEVETPDHHYYHLAFFTTRKVKAMEELTWDYGIDFDDHDHPIKAFRCQCGSKFCRNIKRSRSRARR